MERSTVADTIIDWDASRRATTLYIYLDTTAGARKIAVEIDDSEIRTASGHSNPMHHSVRVLDPAIGVQELRDSIEGALRKIGVED